MEKKARVLQRAASAYIGAIDVDGVKIAQPT
jgi:hypothetical protein